MESRGDGVRSWARPGDTARPDAAHQVTREKDWLIWYLQGDGSTGRLTSPSFVLQRKYINFLIGGGSAGERASICWSMARSSARPPAPRRRADAKLGAVHVGCCRTGRPDGAARDRRQGDRRWGHINIDQIVQSDRRQPSRGSCRAELYRRDATARSSTSRAKKNWLNDPNGLVYLQGRVPSVLPAQSRRASIGAI